MNRPPRPTQQPLLPLALILRSGLVSSIMVAGGLGLFLWEYRVENTGLASARTAVVNVVVLVQILYLFNCRTLKHSALSLGLFTNRWVITGALTMLVAQIAFTHASVLNQLFHSAPISGGAWLRVIAAAVIVFLAVEFEKWLRFRRVR